jgi:hypothetical protein
MKDAWPTYSTPLSIVMSIVVLMVIAVVWSGSALAYQQRGWFMGGGWGIATYNHDGEFDFPGASLDDRDSSTQIFGGYRVTKHFAVEGRFTDLGDYELDDGPLTVSFEFTSWSLHGQGIYPFGESGFDIYGHAGLGVLFRETKVRIGDEVDDSQSTGLFSAGAAVRYTPPKVPSVSFLLGYDWYTFDASINGNAMAQGFKVTKLGLQYNF